LWWYLTAASEMPTNFKTKWPFSTSSSEGPLPGAGPILRARVRKSGKDNRNNITVTKNAVRWPIIADDADTVSLCVMRKLSACRLRCQSLAVNKKLLLFPVWICAYRYSNDLLYLLMSLLSCTTYVFAASNGLGTWYLSKSSSYFATRLENVIPNSSIVEFSRICKPEWNVPPLPWPFTLTRDALTDLVSLPYRSFRRLATLDWSHTTRVRE